MQRLSSSLEMGFLRDTTGSQKVVIYLNAIIRLLQFVIAAVALAVYVQETGYWATHGFWRWAMVS